MRVLRWLERKFFTGEVIRDYGNLGELTGFGSPGQISLMLCKRRGQLLLVLKTSTHFELNWYPVKASASMAATLAEVAEDVFKIVETGTHDAVPEPPGLGEETAIYKRASPLPNENKGIQ